MPTYWYSYRDCMPHDGDDADTIKQKEFNRRIVASNKPYFMTYVYPELRKKSNAYIKSNSEKAVRLFSDCDIDDIESLYAYEPKTDAMKEFISHYENYAVTGNNPCTVNRICWLTEHELDGIQKHKLLDADFDYSILKCGVSYAHSMYNRIAKVYENYKQQMAHIQSKLKQEKTSADFDYDSKYLFAQIFLRDCLEICPNEEELCDIIVDMCYKTEGMKAFAWDMVGDVIVRNLLKRSENYLSIPVCTNESSAEFYFAGKWYKMCRVCVNNEPDYLE